MELRLAEVRRARHWSQGKLALMSGISRNYISEIESGKHSPSFEMILKMCKAFRCTPNDLFNFKNGDEHMDYLNEIEAFHDWLETNQITARARVLWLALMHLNYKARWAKEITVSVTCIKAKTGMSERSILMAREELEQYGRIVWRPGEDDQTAVYRVISLLNLQSKSIN